MYIIHVHIHIYNCITIGSRLPGDIAFGVPFASIKSGLAAFDDIPAAGNLQLVCLYIFICIYIYVYICRYWGEKQIDG
jgi:hypothetical protein